MIINHVQAFLRPDCYLWCQCLEQVSGILTPSLDLPHSGDPSKEKIFMAILRFKELILLNH